MIDTTRYATAVPVVLALIWLLPSCLVCERLLRPRFVSRGTSILLNWTTGEVQ